MDVMISTDTPYKQVWKKRGSLYLDKDDFEALKELLDGRCFILAEAKEFVGKENPLIASEDLTIILISESDESYEDIDKTLIQLPTIENDSYANITIGGDTYCKNQHKDCGCGCGCTKPDIPPIIIPPIDPTPDTPTTDEEPPEIVPDHDLIHHMDDFDTEEEEKCPWEVLL